MRFNYNEIYGKIVNYKFEQKEKKLEEQVAAPWIARAGSRPMDSKSR